MANTKRHTFGDTELGLKALLERHLVLRKVGFKTRTYTTKVRRFTLHTLVATRTPGPTRRERGLLC
jgi:hypothetical protein